MVVVDLTAVALPGKELAARRPPVCSRALMSHPRRYALYAEVLSLLPSVPWHVHADDHLVIHNIRARSALAIIAPLEKGAPRKLWISEASAGHLAE
eukprot:1519787-Alexandrium_andersonii.AAC.1